MSTDVIGSRYRLGSVVTCTPETTTWDARDTWLDERVLVVTPEPGCDKRFAALAGAVLDRSSSHLLALYDVGSTADGFVVFGVPAATLSEERTPREEEDVLVAGRALGDALEALHERGVVHGDLHPGSVVMAESGDATLSPWPLAPRPHNWSGPGGFGADPDEPREVSARDDVRALGAVLLGALAGPPVLSSEQVGNIERELAGRAPNAVTIADRALTPPGSGGYAVAAELRDDCAAVLAGRPLVPTVPDLPEVAAAGAATEAPEGRRAALVLAASGAALFASFGVAGSIAAGPRAPHPVAAHASGCAARGAAARCAGPSAGAAVRPVTAVPARLADTSGAAAPAPGSAAQATVSTTPPPTGATAARPPMSTTTAPPSTTTSSSPTTTTSAPPPTTTTAPTTTTTAPPPTTTSTSSNVLQAGPTRGTGSLSSSGSVDGTGSGQGY